MKSNAQLVLSRTDYEKIASLLPLAKQEVANLLEEEMSRAEVIDDIEMPEDVVAMNTEVQFVDAESGRKSVLTITYPHEARIEEGKISILTSMGAALIGLKVGQEIRWSFPNGQDKTLKVISVHNKKVV